MELGRVVGEGVGWGWGCKVTGKGKWGGGGGSTAILFSYILFIPCGAVPSGGLMKTKN